MKRSLRSTGPASVCATLMICVLVVLGACSRRPATQPVSGETGAQETSRASVYEPGRESGRDSGRDSGVQSAGQSGTPRAAVDAPPADGPPAVPPAQPATPPASRDVWIETSPGVMVNPARREVYFDGIVPIDCHNPRTPHVYIEIIACTPDSKEHEALVLTRITPSHLHAALVFLGLEPGSPGLWVWEGETLRETPATGPRVNVQLEWTDAGVERTADPREWVVDVRTSQRLSERDADEFWRFAGSRFETRGGREVYVADREGLLLGFACFSGETIAYSRMEHHDSNVQTPIWIADRTIVPAYETPVRVRITVDP
jgi:hypothetical protein